MNRGEIRIIYYGDHAVIVSEDQDNLQRFLQAFHNISKQFNMKISIEKTKSINKQDGSQWQTINQQNMATLKSLDLNESIKKTLRKDFPFILRPLFEKQKKQKSILTKCVSDITHSIGKIGDFKSIYSVFSGPFQPRILFPKLQPIRPENRRIGPPGTTAYEMCI